VRNWKILDRTHITIFFFIFAPIWQLQAQQLQFLDGPGPVLDLGYSADYIVLNLLYVIETGIREAVATESMQRPFAQNESGTSWHYAVPKLE
jgi:hypothetical protein